MSAPKIFTIKESTSELKKLYKSAIPLISKRLEALLIFKAHETTGVSKRVVASMLRVDPNSIQTWRSLYIEGGIETLMSHSKTGFKPSVISKEQEEALRKQMHKADNGFVGFVEFLDWFNTQFGTTTNYKTFHGFVVRKFDAKVKTARKVHIKKDVAKVEEFKKNSQKSAKVSSTKKAKHTIK
jgi:transposase